MSLLASESYFVLVCAEYLDVVWLNEIWQNSISLSQDWTGAEISNIVDYEMVPILHLDISFIC